MTHTPFPRSPSTRPLAAFLLAAVASAAIATALPSLANAAPVNPDGTYSETVGSNANTWSDYADAGGSQGPTIADGTTVEIDCVVQGFAVQDGNTNWYRIASAPWTSAFYVSADAFYNTDQTSGSLLGTPFVDPSVPDCAPIGGGTLPPPPVPGPQSAGPTPAPSTPNEFYNRSAAVAWALAHAQDDQPYGTMCTWFVSQALWAGGFPTTSSWTGSGSFPYDLVLRLPGTKDAWYLPWFLGYLESHFWPRSRTSRPTSGPTPWREPSRET